MNRSFSVSLEVECVCART